MEKEKIGTEQYAVKKAEEQSTWENTYGRRRDEIEAMFDGILKDRQSAGERLAELFSGTDFWKPYVRMDAVAKMYVIAKICEREQGSDADDSVLKHGRNVRELAEYLDSLKFLLYRVDFEIDGEAESELMASIEKQAVSMDTLRVMLETNVMRARELAVRLEKKFDAEGMLGQQFAMVHYLSEKYPADIRYMEKESQLYGLAGRAEKALEARKKLEVYRKLGIEWQTLTEIQSELWNLKYDKTWDAGQLIQLLRQSHIGDSVWKQLLLLQGKCSEDFYCRIGNAFLDENMAELCRKTLEAAEETEGAERHGGQ